MPSFRSTGMKELSWAMATVLTFMGYLLLLLVSIFPFWVRLVDQESHEVFFSGLFENCFHIKCWKPRPLSTYIVLGRVFMLSAVGLAFVTTFFMVFFDSDLLRRTRRPNVVLAFCSLLTGACASLALLLHTLEIRHLRMNSSPPQFFVQWPYYILSFSVLLFVVTVMRPGAICLSEETSCRLCHWWPISRVTEEPQGITGLEKLESFGGGLSLVQQGARLQEETVI
ncbi:transmembrane protein 225B [Ctenodactylus gundi]